MFKDFYHTFYYGFLIIAAIISLLYYKKVDKVFRWLCFLVIITLASELVAKSVVSFPLYKSNDFVYHFFTPIEYFIYTIIYKMFFNSKKWNKVLLISFAGLTIAEILNTVFFQDMSKTPTNIMITESVLLVFLSLNLFIKIRETAIYENILKEGVFWFNSAVLFYYSFNILVWGFHNIKIYEMKNPPDIIYDINLLFSGLLYMVYAASVLLNFISIHKIAKKP